MANSKDRLQGIAAPNLPVATQEYDRLMLDKLTNTLRLYFNQIAVNLNSLASSTGGRFVSAPHGQFLRTTNQTAAANTAAPVTFDTTDISNGVSIGTTTSHIIFQYAGTYNIQFSAQLDNSSSSTIDDVTFWFRLNGVDIANSAGIVGVNTSHGGVHGLNIASWNMLITVDSLDYVELVWSTDSGNGSLATYAAGTSPTHPASPSVIFTATFVAAPSVTA